MISQQFTQGGCQADTSISPNGRTSEDTDKSHRHMVDTYYPFAKFRKTKKGILRSQDGIRKLRIEWDRAYKSGGKGNLEDFLIN